MSAETVEATLEDDPITLDSLALQISRVEGEVSQILSFCTTLAAMLDAMGSNPMVAAMMPPGVFSQD